jgi:NADP-dependent 3-hydroxy acid dehydrogenase YdfG
MAVIMHNGIERWRGRVALVTGASSGIGAATALALARAGLRVTLAGRDEARLHRIADTIAADGGECHSMAVDLTETGAPAELVRRAIAHWNAIDVLVNNAGTSGGVGVVHGDLARFRACFDLNVHAVVGCIQEAMPAMAARPEAAIINIGSLAGHRIPRRRGDPSVAYAASKHALRVFTDGLRMELSANRQPIKVALISPGLVDTPWHAAHGQADRESAYGFRPLDPEDIAQAVLYILSTPPHVQVCDLLLRPSGQDY